MAVPRPFADAVTKSMGVPAPEWVYALRASGRAWLEQHQLPTLSQEDWKYTSLRILGDLEFNRSEAAHAVNEAQLSSRLIEGAVPIVFIDGILSPTYSRLGDLPAGVEVKQLHEAWESVQHVLQNGAKDHAFAQLNLALLERGAVVTIASQTRVAKPIQLLHWLTPANGRCQVSSPYFVLQVGESAEASVYETYGGETGKHLVAARFKSDVGANAVLHHYRLQCENTEAFHFSVGSVDVARDARCNLFCYSQGARLARTDIDAEISGSGAHLELHGVYLAKTQQHTDFHTSIDHQTPNSQSSQFYKGVLNDRARAVFNGKVLVRKGAHGTSAFQLNKTLLLSESTEMDTKPELQIDADDVKCSHGATIGSLNEEEIFYLTSRAISVSQARTMLSKAYVGDVIQKLDCEPGRRWLKHQLDGFFGGGF